MGSKKHSDFTPQPQKARPVKDILIDVLRDQLATAAERETELLRQLAAKDAQIQMVLEERFFKPIVTRPESEKVVASTPIDPGSIVDNTVFPTEGDKKAMETADKATKDAQEKLLEELRALEEEQAADHTEEQPVEEAVSVNA